MIEKDPINHEELNKLFADYGIKPQHRPDFTNFQYITISVEKLERIEAALAEYNLDVQTRTDNAFKILNSPVI